MPDPRTPTPSLDGLGDLPIQPTGSGVADLEVAYEQMRLADAADGGDTPSAGPENPEEDAGDVIAETAAHPS